MADAVASTFPPDTARTTMVVGLVGDDDTPEAYYFDAMGSTGRVKQFQARQHDANWSTAPNVVHFEGSGATAARGNLGSLLPNLRRFATVDEVLDIMNNVAANPKQPGVGGAISVGCTHVHDFRRIMLRRRTAAPLLGSIDLSKLPKLGVFTSRPIKF